MLGFNFMTVATFAEKNRVLYICVCMYVYVYIYIIYTLYLCTKFGGYTSKVHVFVEALHAKFGIYAKSITCQSGVYILL